MEFPQLSSGREHCSRCNTCGARGLLILVVLDGRLARPALDDVLHRSLQGAQQLPLGGFRSEWTLSPIFPGSWSLDRGTDRCAGRLVGMSMFGCGREERVVIHGVLLDIDVEVVRRNPADQGKGFVPQPKRWIVEQVNGTLMLHRRLARE
ncbi:hypothetical protein [Streptomyces sp. NPDC057939]|uniref:hypothetical protein n=1 Tax=Streptomyces sp. NPDC057939 TaxID=3346284 RepID=UPI0036EC7599